MEWNGVPLFGLANLQWSGVVHDGIGSILFHQNLPFFSSQFGGNGMKSQFSLLIENNYDN